MTEANYQIGLLTNFLNASKTRRTEVAVCNCGQYNLLLTPTTRNSPKCNKCGNVQFFQPECNKRFVVPYLRVIEKNYRGFKIERINLSISYDEEYNVTVHKENTKYYLEYDMVDKVMNMKKFNPKGEEQYIDERRRFFQKVNMDTFIEMISFGNNKDLYDYTYRYNSYYYGRRTMKDFLSGLRELWEKTYLQILSNAGYKDISRFRGTGYSYTTKKNVIDTTGTSPAKILNLPKFLLDRVKTDVSIDTGDIRSIQNLLTKVDGNKLREMVEIAEDEASLSSLISCADTILDIHNTYGYNNLKKLLLYVIRDVRINQGIMNPSNASTLLRDYLRMMNGMHLSAEKYPRSLKKDHDIAMMNHRTLTDEHKRKLFATVILDEYYGSLEYHSKKFSIIKPLGADDLVNEGTQLSHCVASYIDDVCGRRCQILFLRDAEDISKPLATVEVRNGKVRQARGQSNRALTKTEHDFLKEWSKEKEIPIKVY